MFTQDTLDWICHANNYRGEKLANIKNLYVNKKKKHLYLTVLQVTKNLRT